MERLQKVLAAAGVGSRRYCEQLIVDGHVTVDGMTVRTLGTKVDMQRNVIAVDGRLVAQQTALVTVALHKPKGVLSTVRDPAGRSTVIDYMHGVDARVYPVGRLDYDSEGLLLLTNDGALAQALTHPKHHVPKTYWIYTDVIPHGSQLDKLRNGLYVDGVRTLPAEVDYVDVDVHRNRAIVSMTLVEGRNRQIRRMWEQVRLPILRLKRVSIGPLLLGGLPRGKHRLLHSDEVQQLWSCVRGEHPGTAR